MERALRPLPALSPRLAALARAVERDARVADVGAGHGRLALWLAATGRAAFCLATERTETLLAGVARPLGGAGWSVRIAFRAGDGLAALKAADRIDTAVVAGLGGRAIARLLDARAAGLRRLVLQPRTEAGTVRRRLSELGFTPVAEELTLDRGRTHLTIVAEPGDDAACYGGLPLDREDLYEAGPILLREAGPEVAAYWRSQRDRLRAIGRGGAEAERARRVLAFISTRAL
jgi:tRNA (adenine22-N1)-methyltransferase